VCLVAALFLASGPGAFAAETTTSTNPGTARIRTLRDLLGLRSRPRPKPVSVPEPATLAMIVAGLAGVGALRHKKRT
jgi:hypothetical protein